MILLRYVMIIIGNALEVNLVQINDCVCPGYKLVYECTLLLMGGESAQATVWRGTAFNGCNHMLVLHHSNFTSVKTCNNGRIVAKAISENGGYYISQLSVTVSTDLIGKTVECSHDDGRMSTPGKVMIIPNITGRLYYYINLWPLSCHSCL